MSKNPASHLFREARIASYEAKIDPENQLTPEERRRRAEEADAARYRRMGQRSGESRRRRAALLAKLQQEAFERAIVENAIAERVAS